jgi:dTDP-4-dehydrorhamnose reductase
MKVLLTGARGQVGAALLSALRPFEVVATDRARLDLANPDSIAAALRDVRPDVIVNPAAFTSVDQAEAQPELARAVNADAPGILANEARKLGALLVHFSTDYVFDGALRRPYVETDPAAPLSTYGRTKLEGEAQVRASGCRHAILRTSWVYGGAASFPTLIIGKAKKREALKVVADQTGVPTWATDVAALTKALIEKGATGLWHASASGAVTRYDYAVEILRLANMDADIRPISTPEFPSPAKRPAYSALDSRALERATGIPAIGPWRERLEAFMRGVS